MKLHNWDVGVAESDLKVHNAIEVESKFEKQEGSGQRVNVKCN